MSSLDQARALLQGSYDLHIHPIPSHVPRLLDDFEVLAQAEEAGMAGVLLKNHYEPTGARAILANRRGEGFRAKAYGAAVLNWVVIGVIVLTTVYSGVEYFIQNWKCLWS